MTAAYQDFERLQRCSSCGTGVVPAEQPRVCPSCFAVHACPRVEDWPPRMIAFLCRRLVQQWLRPFSSMTRQAQMEALLKSVFRGETVAGQTMARAATADDLWPLALRTYEEWVAAGQRAVEQ
ncbi:MAG: hypothetical protein ACSLFE_08265 [Gemmatimonadaceae bacterium]